MTKRASKREKVGKKRDKFKIGDLVFVKWADSRGANSSWTWLDNLKEWDVCICKSVGWLIRDDKKAIHIVPHIADDRVQGCGDMTIPRSQIIKIKKL